MSKKSKRARKWANEKNIQILNNSGTLSGSFQNVTFDEIMQVLEDFNPNETNKKEASENLEQISFPTFLSILKVFPVEELAKLVKEINSKE